MDQIDINTWLNGDNDIMDSLVGLASIPDAPTTTSSSNNHPHPQNSGGADILNYLLQTDDNNTNSAYPSVNTQHTQPPALSTVPAAPSTSTLQQANQTTEEQPPVVISDAMFRNSVSVVRERDNFVTFLPHSTPATKKQTAPKKAKLKEPIFVTESPQSYEKKKKKQQQQHATVAVNPTHHSSSAEDNSDDDMLLEDGMQHHSNASMKQMTSKERRQLRNKISARNFRVRRKEYITQLEEKVSNHEQTIDALKKENEKLRLANQELMKQLLLQPITPPSSSGEELLSGSSTSSGSEGQHSPDAIPPAYQFQLNDLYDFNLFDQQAAQQQTQLNDMSNLFYLNHATMPDWDMTQVLSDKGTTSISPQDYQRELSRELINDYPLLAPALMSIVLRHTLSLEYVAALAKEFSDKVGADLIGADHTKAKHTGDDDDQETLGAFDMEDLKASFNTLKIEDKQASTEKKPEPSELELTKKMLTKHYKYYVMYRARGMTHDEIMERSRPCLLKEGECASLMTRLKSKLTDQGRKEEEGSSSRSKDNNNIHTLQTYCRVAGNLLRHPHRMARVGDIVQREIKSKETRAASYGKSLLRSSHQNPGITT